MSSLLQFNGKVTQQGVHLEFYQVVKNQPWAVTKTQTGNTADTDGIYLPGGKWLPRIWTCVHKPCGMFGCWVVFEYNGEEQVPDLSCPIAIEKLPHDARPLATDECIARWQS
jgi:hypothetical protein